MKFIVDGPTFTCVMAKRVEEFNEADHLVGTTMGIRLYTQFSISEVGSFL